MTMGNSCKEKKSLWRGSIIFFCLCFFAVKGASTSEIGSYIWTNVPAFSQNINFLNPVCIASTPGETNRLFIIENRGSIIVITNLANPTKTVFLNISSRVHFGGEDGIVGLAFHPGYATNGYFYVYYKGGAASGTQFLPPPYTNVLSRFQVLVTNPNQADTNSELRLFGQYTPTYTEHIGGDLHFGSDGYLYISVGDGVTYSQNAQRITNNLFSGILRIDVDKRPESLIPNPSPTGAVTTNYAIPSDNPFVGATNFDGVTIDPNQVRTEFWAVGLREPWRFTFDSLTGLLYCGDVGNSKFEEIDIITKGGNYGWAAFEGTNSPPSGLSTNGLPVPQNPILPIINYVHGGAVNQGNCVVGGVVYRGNRFPQLYGAYVFGDWYGKIWASVYDGTNATLPLLLCSDTPVAFGVDPRNGDILYANYSTGAIKRLISLTPNINMITCSASNFIISGAGGQSLGTNYLLASVDVSKPMVNWTTVATNQSDSFSNFSFTNAVDPNAPTTFYRIKLGP